MKSRTFASTSSVRKTAITTRVLDLIHQVRSRNSPGGRERNQGDGRRVLLLNVPQVVRKKIHITKRDLFYTDVKLFTKQEEVSLFFTYSRLTCNAV